LVASVSADCLPGSHATLSAFIVLSCVFWQINTCIKIIKIDQILELQSKIKWHLFMWTPCMRYQTVTG